MAKEYDPDHIDKLRRDLRDAVVQADPFMFRRKGTLCLEVSLTDLAVYTEYLKREYVRSYTGQPLQTELINTVKFAGIPVVQNSSMKVGDFPRLSIKS